jgi:hypothetical protein
MEEKMATIPSASGENNLVTTGMTSTLSACANTDPVTSFRTLPEKLLDAFVKEDIFTNPILD